MGPMPWAPCSPTRSGVPGRRSVRQGDDMHRISAWAAIWAVPTLLAGIYGMNFRYMLELGWRFGYPLVLVVMVVICLGLYRAFRRYGWLCWRNASRSSTRRPGTSTSDLTRCRHAAPPEETAGQPSRLGVLPHMRRHATRDRPKSASKPRPQPARTWAASEPLAYSGAVRSSPPDTGPSSANARLLPPTRPRGARTAGSRGSVGDVLDRPEHLVRPPPEGHGVSLRRTGSLYVHHVT